MSDPRLFKTFGPVGFVSISICVSISLADAPIGSEVEAPLPDALPALEVTGQRTANPEPAGTFASPVSRLNLEPFVDIQTRNLTEAQGDVTIRGGIFENTGFRLGAVTLFDPQTGHYFAEIPVAPEFLEAPAVYTGTENALRGFNSSVGTIGFSFAPIHNGGGVTIGFGDKNLNYQRLVAGMVLPAEKVGDGWSWGLQGEVSRSEGDGTRANGEHTFNRYSGRFELTGPNSRTTVFGGYQAKFFSWPNLYTPFPGFIETENLQTSLLGISHEQSYGWERSFEVTAYYRRNRDDYTILQFPGLLFDHETEVAAIGWDGRHAVNDFFFINYAGQLQADSITSTTLENNFTSRSYAKGVVLPEYQIAARDDQLWILRAGISYDYTNRDGGAWSPIAEIAWEAGWAEAEKLRLHFGYSEATQVPGYTAIGGPAGGPFASNPDLGRERSRNLELGADYKVGSRRFVGTLFHRWDDDLVDWTFSNLTPTQRAANNVDIRSFGIELLASQRWDAFEALLGYTFLNKSEDYRDATVDASFYALNYPRHRITLAGIVDLTDHLRLRIDNEYRHQVPNNLRAGRRNAVYTNLGATYSIPKVVGLELNLRIDNLWKTNFQEVPGTPGRGRQSAIDLTYRW